MVLLVILGQIWSFLSVPGLGVWTDLRVEVRMGRGNHQIDPPYSRHPPFMSHLATFWVILDPSNSVSTLCKSGPKSAFWVRLWGIFGSEKGSFWVVLDHVSRAVYHAFRHPGYPYLGRFNVYLGCVAVMNMGHFRV